MPWCNSIAVIVGVFVLAFMVAVAVMFLKLKRESNKKVGKGSSSSGKMLFRLKRLAGAAREKARKRIFFGRTPRQTSSMVVNPLEVQMQCMPSSARSLEVSPAVQQLRGLRAPVPPRW